MEQDPELKLIERRKLAAMKKKIEATTPTKTERSDKEVLESLLYDRGDEVLEVAYSSYPKETERVVSEFSKLIRNGRFARKISGGELYSLFRQVGLRFQLKTTIKVQDRGKLVDLSEKLKIKDDE